MSQQLDLQYYEILGVSPSASMEEIETAYQRARQIYSSGNPEFQSSFDEEEAAELMAWIEEAYHEVSRRIRNQNSFVTAPPKYQFDLESDDASVEELIDSQLEDELIKTSFYDGLLLKKVRLKKNISLNYISNKTCIGVHHLIAIEANDFQLLPAAVFVRSYVKQLAQILGLDTKDVSDSYMRLYIEARGED